MEEYAMPSIFTADPANPIKSRLALQSIDGLDSGFIGSEEPVISVEPAGGLLRQRRLATRIEELVAAARRRDASMAVLSHELASPLASIQNAVAILRLRSNDATVQVDMHALIERQLRQIGVLTATLAEAPVSTLEDLEQVKLHRERIDLCVVLERAAETVRPALIERSHKLSVVWPETPVWVIADAGRLEQVFVNLLSNASKYTERGGEILMSMHVNLDHVAVQVRDSGIGIAIDVIPHIFNLFARGDSPAVRTRPGRGIGLALVRSILASHGGTIAASSAGIGLGSEFTVRLKLEPAAG
jgi:signal transduction histidine kinase